MFVDSVRKGIGGGIRCVAVCICMYICMEFRYGVLLPINVVWCFVPWVFTANGKNMHWRSYTPSQASDRFFYLVSSC